ncbi:MAG: hypothetical protein WEB00_04785 [Dehalococcoidia bacterium]
MNATDSILYVYLGDGLGADDGPDVLPAETETKLGTIKAVWEDVIVVRVASENILLRQELTWDELGDQGFRVVIDEQDLNAGDCHIDGCT